MSETLGSDPEFDHPSWRAALATAASYGVVLFVLFVLLFLVPYVLFSVLA